MKKDDLTTEVVEAIKIFQPIRIKVRNVRNELVKKYNWNIKSDVRINAFEQLDNLIYSLNLSSAVSIHGFSNTKWINYQLFRNKELTQKEREQNFKASRMNLHSFHRIGFMYCLTQIIEGVIRSIARKIIPEENGTGNFGLLCKELSSYLEKPEKITTEMRSALDLLREMRNTIHNNGFYFSDQLDNNNYKINYRGRDYIFLKSQPHNHASYPVLALVTEDIANLIRVLVFDPNILDIENVEGTTGYIFDRLNT